MAHITVRANPRDCPTHFGGGTGRTYRVERAWQVYRDGVHTDYYVVTSDVAMTIIQGSAMITSWHAGISAGDLARLKLADDTEGR